MALEARTSRGTPVEYEIHRGPTGVAGTVAHWGEKIYDLQLKDRIQRVFPEIALEPNTGFNLIWHQFDGTSRPDGIKDELEVAEFVAQQTLDANGWDAKDVKGLFVGSGVPIADDPKYKNYARAIADRVGLREDAYLHTSYAACASGGYEFIEALKNPMMEGEPVIVMGMEGISYLTEDFNPDYADHLSMRFFGNGAAGIGFIPGKNLTLLHSDHMVVPDSKNTLTAKMTYEGQIDPDGDTWQESDGISMIRYPKTEGIKRIAMQGARTGQFFYSNGLELLTRLSKSFEAKFPDIKTKYGAAHHPSKTVHEHLVKKLKDAGINIDIPWVVRDGNSSAATSLIAELRLLNEADEGSVQLFSAYGAGGSFDGAFILNGKLTENLSSDK